MILRELLAKHGIPVAADNHHHARRGWLQFDCPFCSKNSRRYRMGYSISRGSVNCWVCGKHSLKQTLDALDIRLAVDAGAPTHERLDGGDRRVVLGPAPVPADGGAMPSFGSAS